MAIYGISDLHLSLNKAFDYNNFNSELDEYKPMAIFGEHWQNHIFRLYENWQKVISDNDIVLMPGDLSWAMSYDECQYDFEFLKSLKGRIIICKGNHDYWWNSKKKVDELLPDNVLALQHQSIILEDIVLSATRGWICPNSKDFSAEDNKIYQRELIRLEIALKEANRLIENSGDTNNIKEKWVMLHYRPTNDKFEYNQLIELLQKYNVKKCLYGHIHGKPAYNVLIGEKWGIDFTLLSSDYLEFKPLFLR